MNRNCLKSKLIAKFVTLALVFGAFCVRAQQPTATEIGDTFSNLIRSNRYHLPGGQVDITPAFMGYVTGLGNFNSTVVTLPVVSHVKNGPDRNLMFFFVDGEDTTFYVTPVSYPHRGRSDRETYTPKDETNLLLQKLDGHIQKQNLVIVKADGSIEGSTNSDEDGRLMLDLLGRLHIAKDSGMQDSTAVAIRYRAKDKESAVQGMIQIAGVFFETDCGVFLTTKQEPPKADPFKPLR